MKSLFHQLVVCTALLVPAALFAQPAGTIIIDNVEAQFEGSWLDSDKKLGSKDRFGDNYKFSSTKERGGSKAIFPFKIPAAGKYNVELMYGQGPNRSQKAQWTINNGPGAQTVEVNQQVNGGKWVVIGHEVPFHSGEYSVELSNAGAEGSVVVADAVRLVPLTAPTGFTLNAVAAFGGKVTKNPEQSSFEKDSEVLLTATANEGYVFGGWSGDATGYKNPMRMVMTGNKTVTANFIAAGVGVIMDNPMAKFTPADKWQLSSTNWPGTRYEDYQFTTARPTVEARAIFTPVIPRAGKYDVYVWYAQGVNRAAKVPWLVVHKGGTVKATVDQRTGGGQWQPIASSVEFAAGKNDKQYVEVNNGTGPEPAGAVVIADAVAFVYTGN